MKDFGPGSIWIGNNCILIASNGILKFDRDGRFVKALVSKGGGPKEVPFVGDFYVQNNLIYITSGTICKIYDFDGNLLNTIEIPVYSSGFHVEKETMEFVTGLSGFGSNASQRLAFFSEGQIPQVIMRPYTTEGTSSEPS